MRYRRPATASQSQPRATKWRRSASQAKKPWNGRGSDVPRNRRSERIWRACSAGSAPRLPGVTGRPASSREAAARTAAGRSARTARRPAGRLGRRRRPGWLPAGRRRPERRLAPVPAAAPRAGTTAVATSSGRALDAEPAREQQEVEALLAHAQVDVEDGDESCRRGRRDHAPDRRGERVEDEAGDGVARRVGERDPDDEPGQRAGSRSRRAGSRRPRRRRSPTTCRARARASARARGSARPPRRAAPGRRPRRRRRGRSRE